MPWQRVARRLPSGQQHDEQEDAGNSNRHLHGASLPAPRKLAT
jgi:hypothetical protein